MVVMMVSQTAVHLAHRLAALSVHHLAAPKAGPMVVSTVALMAVHLAHHSAVL